MNNLYKSLKLVQRFSQFVLLLVAHYKTFGSLYSSFHMNLNLEVVKMQVDQEQVSRREKVFVEQHGDHVHQESIVEDISLSYRQTFIRVTQLIWLFFGTIEGLLGIRLLLKLIAANPNSGFTSFVYHITDLFIWPFINITGSPSFENYILEVPAIFAIMAYMLVAWIIVRLVWIIFYHPPANQLSIYDQEGH